MSEDDDEERNELTLRRSLFEESDLLFSNQQPSTTVCRLASNPTNPSPPERVTNDFHQHRVEEDNKEDEEEKNERRR